MINSDALNEAIQQPDVGALIVLFDLDCTGIGGEVYYFTQSCYSADTVRWKGNDYTPIDIEAEGFEVSGKGTLPRPKLRISNVPNEDNALLVSAITYLVQSQNDLLGAIVTRWRTLRELIGDEYAYFPPDIYVVERKSAHNKFMIEWELSSLLDYEGQKLPRRQIIRDICTHVYRRWSTTEEEFIYTAATCPYSGDDYFDETGEVTVEPSEDRCGKKLSDCKLRFPGKTPLPTRAFPGVGKNRLNA